MVTIKHVAKHSGVSEATVSRVINGNSSVDPELRQRVLESIAALNYHPSGVARSLRRQQTRAVGLIVPDNRNPFFAEIARGIEMYCNGFGYSVYLCNSDDEADRELAYCETLYQQRVAGVIIAITGVTGQAIHYLQSRNMPVVLLDRGLSSTLLADTVQCDHYAGACRAIEYLLELGHCRIGVIAGERYAPYYERLHAYRDVLNARQLDIDERLIFQHSGQRTLELETGYLGAGHLLQLTGRPTAIFATNDMMAIGAMRWALEHGLRVPDDLSIVGVDDIPISSYVTPSLTTIAQPMIDLGREAAELLLSRIQDSSRNPIHELIAPSLIIRESTARASI